MIALVGRVTLVGGGFVTHTLLVRNLDPDIFGVLSLALAIVSACAGFAAIGMNQAAGRFIGGANRNEASGYIVICVSVVFVSGIFTMLILYTFRGRIEYFFTYSGLSSLLKIFAVLVILRPLAQVSVGVAQGFKKTRWKVVGNDILPFIVSLPILCYFILQKQIITGAILYYILTPIVRITILTMTLRRWKDWTFSMTIPSKGQYFEILSFSWPLAFESLVVVFLGSIDILMLGRLATADLVGLYRSVQPVSKMLFILMTSLSFIYLPIATEYFENDDISTLNTVYKTSTRWVTQATFPLFIFYIFFGEDLITVFFGTEYVAAWGALIVLSVGMYSRVVAGPNGMTIKAIKKTRIDLWASVGALLINIVLNILLIPMYGMIGAAVATATSYMIYNIIDLIILYKNTGVNPFHWDLVVPFFPTIIVIIVLTHFYTLKDPSIIKLLLIGLTILAIHLLSIMATTGLTDEDKMLIKSIRS